MSLHARPKSEVPEETKKVARAAFPKGNIYIRMRDKLGVFFNDEQFASLFSQRGQPAISSWRLALVSVMQFVENLSDRQAAEAVRARIDWKIVGETRLFAFGSQTAPVVSVKYGRCARVILRNRGF
jgi:transposase